MKNLTKQSLLSLLLLSLFALLAVGGCASRQYTEQEKLAETKELNSFLNELFDKNVERYPTWQTYLGLKTNYGKLNNETEAYSLESLALAKQSLKDLQKFNFDALTPQAKLSYRLFEKQVQQKLDSWKWRFHGFPLNQMFGYHSGTASFMINMHRVSTMEHAQAYISRLREIKRVFSEKMVHNLKMEEKGIIPPAFVYAKVIEDSQNIITGAPFTKSQNLSPLFEDFKNKVDKLKIKKATKKKLMIEAQTALMESVGPAYKDLISFMERLSKKQKRSDGAWSLPNGQEYYRFRLKAMTTTDMGPKEIHDFGVQDVARIHNEMRAIMKTVGFKGNLQEFFTFMKQDKRFVFPDNKVGRAAYLKKAGLILDKMEAALPKMFATLPKAKLEVKAVEAYREKSAGIAFYQGPSLYGDRPGIFYVNLYKMADNPIYKMEALAYHEGLPGHHMQNAIKTEMKDLPKFRRVGGYTAYGEGWGLYSERLPKEFGFYRDPYSDFGRLSLELWRAARLVVDTGLHDKRWTREKAIAYLKHNTPNADLEITKGIERYIVMPGQATTYKIGMRKILELRAKARKKLGARFDLRAFHDVVLRSGPVPLDILEENVDEYIKSI